MDHLGFHSTLKCRVYQVVAGIYALGKVEFETNGINDGCMLSKSTETLFDLAANLLSLNRTKLAEVLTTRTIQPKGQRQDGIM